MANSEEEGVAEVGREPTVDETDRIIISFLQRDSRTPAAEIAKRLGLSETTVRNRIRKLADSGVIRSFTVNLDLSKLGKQVAAFVMVNTRRGQQDVAKELLEVGEAVEIYSVTGEFDYVIRVICESPSELEKIIDKFRLRPSIEKTTTFVVLSTVRQGGIVQVSSKEIVFETETK
jgi:Lrp/AsnC family transcriptional regulator for asnA, asnC and gidA